MPPTVVASQVSERAAQRSLFQVRGSALEYGAYRSRQRSSSSFGQNNHGRRVSDLDFDVICRQVHSREPVYQLALLVTKQSSTGRTVHINDQRTVLPLGAKKVTDQVRRQLTTHLFAQALQLPGDCSQLF